MSSDTNNRIPAPLYAVAGAGEYAYRQLRKLPAVAAELREELPQRVADLRVELTGRRVPAAVNSLLAGGLRVYSVLVARGERVVNRGRRQAATTVAPAGDVVRKPTGRTRATTRPTAASTTASATTSTRAAASRAAASRSAASRSAASRAAASRSAGGAGRSTAKKAAGTARGGATRGRRSASA